MHNRSPRQLLTLTVAALAGGFALGTAAQTTDQPQGIYSADDILDAEVYLSENPDQEVGEVEDILFNEAMQVTALVIESGSVLGLGGREIIVEAGQFSLLTETQDDDDVEHRVMLDATAAELENYPVFSDAWWQQARLQARDAWEQTQEGAQSAWQQTQEGAERAWETTQENAQRAWEAARDTLSDGNN
ncbi:PRC-barrel domain-containing protein [Halomonas sp. NO4]|uniref:PRC-barrel domain-containing protein n=1 Tax=Halomonas sp. NO4 TaxID=2484813 RepID=UPI0013D859A9|nr:PRC-barrel domain-containing protein [Halomonas sp. NO4]